MPEPLKRLKRVPNLNPLRLRCLPRLRLQRFPHNGFPHAAGGSVKQQEESGEGFEVQEHTRIRREVVAYPAVSALPVE